MPIYALGGVRPHLGRDVFVADTAVVIADVHLGDQASVWFGAVVRGDVFPIRIGARTNIQDNAVVHVTRGSAPTTIGEDVVVGHSAVLHGCTIGRGCLIGMASIVLDGAVVGDESLIAAGTLVTPCTIIPPRSFVLGRPARVFRQVSDEDRASILEGVADYVATAREFIAGCTRIG